MRARRAAHFARARAAARTHFARYSFLPVLEASSAMSSCMISAISASDSRSDSHVSSLSYSDPSSSSRSSSMGMVTLEALP